MDDQKALTENSSASSGKQRLLIIRKALALLTATFHSSADSGVLEEAWLIAFENASDKLIFDSVRFAICNHTGNFMPSPAKVREDWEQAELMREHGGWLQHGGSFPKPEPPRIEKALTPEEIERNHEARLRCLASVQTMKDAIVLPKDE